MEARGWSESGVIPDAALPRPAEKVKSAAQPFTLTRSRKATGGSIGRIPPDKRARTNSRYRATNVLAPYFASRSGCASDADSMVSELVPIRLNIDKFGIRVRETFTWNRNDQAVRPKAFAVQFCHDEELPNCMVSPITTAIEEQLNLYAPVAAAVASAQSSTTDSSAASRVTKIELSLQVGSTTLTDSFFWDHAEKSITPESFANMLCSDMGLAGAYVPKIAHAIREQLLADRQAAMQEQPGEEETPLKIRDLSECFRIEDGDKWSPVLQYKGATEYERRLLQEAFQGRLRKRAHDTNAEESGGGMTMSRRAGRPRKDVSYAELANNNDDLLDDVGTGRRSARARKDVVYAPPRAGDAARAADISADPTKKAVVVDYTDTSAFPRIERVPISKPSKEVQEMLYASREGGAANGRTVLSETEQELLDTLRQWTKKKPAVDADDDDDNDDTIAQMQALDDALMLGHHHSMFGGPVKVYKDNAFNRRLGRVGHVKVMKRGPYHHSSK